MIRALVLPAAIALAAMAPARAQVRLDVILGPTFNRFGGAEMLRDSSSSPQSPVADTLHFSTSVGVQAGLGVSVGSGGPLAFRVSTRLATTGPVFDGSSGFDRNALALGVLTVGVEAQVRRAAGPLEFVAFGGPELRYAVDLRGAESADGTDRGFRRSIEPLSTSAVVGAGLRLRAFGTSFGPELRYAFGLSNVSDGEFTEDGTTVRTSDGLRLKQLALGLVVGH